MFTVHRPTAEEVNRFLATKKETPFSYPQVGATWGRIPGSYVVDHHCVYLGQGLETFERAKQAIRRWEMYPREVVTLLPEAPPIEVGTLVAPIIRLFGVWAVAANRIVYVVDECDEITGDAWYGFAYGTLVGHPETGEERFLVKYRARDESVWYDLLAFSRPNHPFAFAAFPFARIMQHRFARCSKRAMQRIFAGSTKHPALAYKGERGA